MVGCFGLVWLFLSQALKFRHQKGFSITNIFRALVMGWVMGVTDVRIDHRVSDLLERRTQ